MHTFANYHPAVAFLYFALVFTFSMCAMQPVCLLISLLCAAWYYRKLKAAEAPALGRAILPVMLLTALINPAFSHAGATVLCYLPSGNPLTLESILYGLAAGAMLGAILLWFACFSQVVTSDKFVYLFGRAAPALALLLSMTFRFVPRFRRQLEQVREVQAGLGRDPGGAVQRIRSAVSCFAAVVSWSMENAIDTADSMKSRGYGTAPRTAYSIYVWESRDRTALVFLLCAAAVLTAGALTGCLRWQWFPVTGGAWREPVTVLLELMWLAVCLMPVYLEEKEVRAWRSSQSDN